LGYVQPAPEVFPIRYTAQPPADFKESAKT